MELQRMIGQKIFKKNDKDELTIYRIKEVRKSKELPKEIKVIDESTDKEVTVEVESLKGFTPLEPDGICTFSIVSVKDEFGKDHKDVIVTGSKFLNLKFGDKMPFCVCRQSITDIFYNLMATGYDENSMLVGLSINADSCPSNFDFRLTLACDQILYSDFINFYRTDTLEDIMKFVHISKFDTILWELFNDYIRSSGKVQDTFKNESGGWCKNLNTLLRQNNFQNDLNEMLGITDVDFELAPFIITKTLPSGDGYQSLTDDLKDWISSIYKIAINDISVLEYNHDINLAEFNNARYFLIRDNTKKLYIVVYTMAGEYKEKDLVEADNKPDLSTQFKIKFYNKYNSSNDPIIRKATDNK